MEIPIELVERCLLFALATFHNTVGNSRIRSLTQHCINVNNKAPVKIFVYDPPHPLHSNVPVGDIMRQSSGVSSLHSYHNTCVVTSRSMIGLSTIILRSEYISLRSRQHIHDHDKTDTGPALIVHYIQSRT